MTNRKLAYIVKDRATCLALADNETVEDACRLMWERRAGSVLVVDTEDRLSGIFTGRDAVRLLAKGKNAGATDLAHVMARRIPVTIAPMRHAVDALRAMSDGGFRHVPVIENGRIRGDRLTRRFQRSRVRRVQLERYLQKQRE